MKKTLALLPCIFLVGCGQNTPNILNNLTIDCQKGVPIFQHYVEKNLLENEKSIWIVDLEMFYNEKLQTCIGKYMAYRKEGGEDDMTIFNIRNIRKNEDIYYEKYSGDSLIDEREGQKKYHEKVNALRGI